MRDWARELLDEMTGLCEVLDHGDPEHPYAHALAVQAAKIDDVALTPSARLMRELADTGESFFELAWRMSRLHKDYFLDLYTPNEERLGEFAAEAASPWRSSRRSRRATGRVSMRTLRVTSRSSASEKRIVRLSYA